MGETLRFGFASDFLSNFYPSPMSWCPAPVVVHEETGVTGMQYRTNEHFFNAHKTIDLNSRWYVASATTPAEAKRRGRAVQLRPGWDNSVRYEVMRQGLALKFADPVLRRLLLDTGTAELVEQTTWHDTHWGICVCSAHGGRGLNHLGAMLMQLREQLRDT